MDHQFVRPGWEPFEEVEPPEVSWRRVKRAIATATDLDDIWTIRSWQSNSRWVFGSHNNPRRVQRLSSTPPHGHDPNGNPWYAAVLYPAPPDPIYELNDLVGLVTWIGHVGCLWPGYYSDLMLPLVKVLGRQSKHFTVPVFFTGLQPTVMLPHGKEMEAMHAQLG